MPRVDDKPKGKEKSKPAPASAERWVSKAVSILVGTGEASKYMSKTVEAEVLGLLAVYPGTGSMKGKWSVAALTVGERVVTVKERDEAKRCASFLWHRLPDCFRHKSHDAMLGAVREASPGVEHWALDCDERECWLDPAEYGLSG